MRGQAMLGRLPWRVLGQSLALGLLLLAMLPFARYALVFGLEGFGLGALRDTYLFEPGALAANVAIFGHMLAGAAVTVLAPLQLSGALRRRYPAWHRWSGRVLVTGAIVAGAAGLTFIAVRGTVGGPVMDLGFGLYGGLMLLCAAQAIRFARGRDFVRHRAWALRLFVLAIGSWLYRVHYGLWYLATNGAGSNPAFSGPFDLVQCFAFYLPYLALVELWLRWRSMPRGVLTSR